MSVKEKNMIERDELKIIAGPCALESQEQALQTTEAMEQLGISIVRAPFIKPRTVHTPNTFYGIGLENALPIYEEMLSSGVGIATEIMEANQIDSMIELAEQYPDQNIMLWLGARKQDHNFQSNVGIALHGAPDNIILGIKNPVGYDEKHWKGIQTHIQHGYDKQIAQLDQLTSGQGVNLIDRLILIHRGFAMPDYMKNGYRNMPDFEMAIRVQEETKLPMMIDPSHIGGSRELVYEVVSKAMEVGLDSFMVEVHPDPDNALTDSVQQLNFEQFNRLLEQIRQPELVRV